MAKEYKELTVNPCKMCMPMGVVSAFYGIRGCMTIIHGSQGCSTYIRRHMATHFNEPIDIASSSLTEQGTVYGGEDNLIKGIENLIKLYNPEVIGVATTCLAETIGEDIGRIISKLDSDRLGSEVKLIPVPSPGYGGTQYEGYWKALRCIVESVEMGTAPNDKINIVLPSVSPADVRHIKEIMELFEIDAVLLPDISENLDSPYQKEYNRLPSGGTSILEIAQMAGAKATIEMSVFPEERFSPGTYLEQEYHVPCIRCPLPVGLRGMDEFLEVLSKFSGRPIPAKLQVQRGRMIDAMIDSHKYNAEGRAAVFGEPDFVYGMVRLCCENSIVPVVTAVGTKAGRLKELLEAEIQDTAKRLFVEGTIILNDTDFNTIEKYVTEMNVNLMIGSSDGRRIEERHDIGLIRCAFPVHDRMGGQRLLSVGYSGSVQMLDSITNKLLEKKENSYRKNIYNSFYQKKEKKAAVNLTKEQRSQEVGRKTETHPCYNCGAGQYARIHLPIAPKCNISCNYCLRKYDCPNESRPGVTSEILSPTQALERYRQVKADMDNLKVVGIAGPGDALANFDEVKESLRLIREFDPQVTFCLSTNGLMLPYYAEELIGLGVTHITVTINAVEPEIGAKIYKYIHFMGQKYEGKQGAEILRDNQLSGLRYLTSKGIACKVNIVMLKGINEKHIADITKKVKECGCRITNIMQMIPVQGSAFEHMPLVTNKELTEKRKECEKFLPQMYHCRQCRSDAVGKLNEDQSIKYTACGVKPVEVKKISTKKEFIKKRFAAASKSGTVIDTHFGHAQEFYIYDYVDNRAVFVERRSVRKYCDGPGNCDTEDKMAGILRAVSDCNGVLALRVGDEPARKLAAQGIQTFLMYDSIENAVKKAATDFEGKESRDYIKIVNS